MRDRKLEEYLQNSLEQKIQPIRLEETIQLCTEIVKKRRKFQEERTGFWSFLSDVFRFEGLTIFGLQAVTLFIVCMLIGTIADIPAYIPVFMPLFVLAVMLVLFRSQFCGMGEVEAVTRASGAQLLLAKLILAGAANLICMTLLLYFEIYLLNSYENIEQLILYCLVPYLICMTAMLRFIRLHRKKNIATCAAAILSLCLFWGILAKELPELYETSAIGIWFIAFFVFALFFIKEIYFIEEMRKEGKIYGIINYKNKIAVDCVSAALKPGVYGLLGANGAGKTTLMRMLCAILDSTSGEVFLNGKDIIEMGADYRNVLGYLPQDFGYYPGYTAMEFLMYISALKGIPKNIAKKRAVELLEEVGLDNVANKKVKTFSGGMKQRVGIAQALLNNPEILILDEPTAGLDPKERVRFRNLLSDYAEDRIVILSTHIVSDIEAIADEVLLMKKGKFALQGSVPELIKKAEGKVWELTVLQEETRKWQAKSTVANLRHEGGQVVLRIISDDKPSEMAVPCEAALEDLYLYYFPTEQGV